MAFDFLLIILVSFPTISENNKFSINLPNENGFGKSVTIPGVEGDFAVLDTDNKGGAYVAYQSLWSDNNSQNGYIHIYFSYSHDFGKTWSKSYQIDDNLSTNVFCDSPSIAYDQKNDYIYIAWKDNRTGVSQVYIDKSIDQGISFSSDIVVYDWNQDLVSPYLPYTVNIKVDETGKLFISWIGYSSSSLFDSDIFFSYSTDKGQSFSNPIIVNTILNNDRVTRPWIVIVDEQTIFVAYSQRTSTVSNIYITRSKDDEISFENPVKITDSSTQVYTGGIMVIASSNETLYAVWTDNRAGNGPQYLDIYYAYSIDDGQSFSKNVRINDDTIKVAPSSHPAFTRGAHGSPAIAIDTDQNVQIVWEDFRNFVDDTTYCRDIYYTSTSNGINFTANTKVNYVNPNSTSVNAADPSIIIDSSNNFFLVFSDAVTGNNDHPLVYFESILQNTNQSSKSTSNIAGLEFVSIISLCLMALAIKRKK